MNQEKKQVDTEIVKRDSGFYHNIPLTNLKRFHNHAFEDYKGEQFDVLVESIRSNGLIHQIVVRPLEDGFYEILSGHNRVAVAKHLGWTEIPAMIRDMTDDEAIIFANEANVAQRRFENWLPSEKAKSIYQYHAGIKKQGYRTDRTTETSGESNRKSKFDARKETARVYRISENTVRLYLDLYRLTESLKIRLDREEFGSTSAQALSSIPEKIQKIVEAVIEEDKSTCEITVDTARKVRDEFKDYEVKDTSEVEKLKDDIRRLLSKETDSPEVDATPVVAIEIEEAIYNLLFPGQEPSKAVVDEIIKAVKAYQEKRSNNTVDGEVTGINEVDRGNSNVLKRISNEKNIN